MLNSFPAVFQQRLMHQYHQDQYCQQIKGEQGHRDMVGNQAEQGRHQTGTHIGAGHLNPDNRLGLIRTKVVGGGVDDAGVNRGAAKAD